MNIAYTMTHGKGDLDKLLADFASTLAERGVRTCGIVQINTDCDLPEHRCDMDVQVLPDGPLIRISQFLGHQSQGCRLDPAALEKAVFEVAQRMQDDFDVFILNKFGKQEADGRGFRDLIAEALSRDAVVIAGTNPLNAEKFEDFSGGIAKQIPPKLTDLLDWFDTTRVD